MQTPSNGLQGPTWTRSLFPNPLLPLCVSLSIPASLLFLLFQEPSKQPLWGPALAGPPCKKSSLQASQSQLSPVCRLHSAVGITFLLDHLIQALINVLAASPQRSVPFSAFSAFMWFITAWHYLFLNCLISVLQENSSAKGAGILLGHHHLLVHSTVPSHIGYYSIHPVIGCIFTEHRLCPGHSQGLLGIATKQ